MALSPLQKKKLKIVGWIALAVFVLISFFAPHYDSTITTSAKVPYVVPGSNDTDEMCDSTEQNLSIKNLITAVNPKKVMWSNGCVKQIYELDTDGKRHGNALLFYPDGKLKENGIYQHDALISRKQYSREGSLILENIIKDDTHDYQIGYDPKTGEFETIINVVFNKEGDPVADGEWFEFTKEPNRFLRVTTYINGVENGEKKEYRADGSLWITTEYKEGKRNGIEVNYDENGKVYATKHYVDDREVP
jgi:antitoxin component YwqK of YwqJK toxin-antitoxin module